MHIFMNFIQFIIIVLVRYISEERKYVSKQINWSHFLLVAFDHFS